MAGRGREVGRAALKKDPLHLTTRTLAAGPAGGRRHVRTPLQRAGHEVFTPSLTGIGVRVHLVSPQVGLTTHVTDVVNAVPYEDLAEIVLLGFS